MPGYLALILHAHLPFVRHPEQKQFLEENWLFEAITETYIPLLKMMQRLVNEAVPFRLTMSITPTLAAMLQDELLRARYVERLDLLLDLARREVERNRDDPRLCKLAQFYLQFFSESRRFFVQASKGDLLAEFRKLQETGVLELIGCSATHAVLPLVHQQSPAAACAQVLIGRDQYVEVFGREPRGFWLPECAYAPELDSILQEANIRWFVLDAHGLMHGNPRPQRAVYAPCYTPAGPAAFARDRDSSRQVWSAREGYPGNPVYREFYRDAGFDLSDGQLGSLASGPRTFSGVKYHRITGPFEEKDLYDPEMADQAAQQHADHFLAERKRQIRELGELNFDPIVMAPFDAELFGHWWFEGPQFLEYLIRKAAVDAELQLITPSEFLSFHPTQQTIQPAASTWGEEGHLGVWLDAKNAWMYPHLHMAARRTSDIARAHEREPKGGVDRAMKQLARELLLAQASDWAFLIKNETAPEYAGRRVTEHLLRFNRLYEELWKRKVDEKFLSECERRDNLFPNVNWKYYCRGAL